MPDFLTEVVSPLLLGLGSALTGWLFARRKQTAEARQSELDTVEKAVAIWRNIAEELEKELKLQREEIASLRGQVEKLHADNTKLLGELKKLKKSDAA